MPGKSTIPALAVVLMLLFAIPARAGDLVFSQGFEKNTAGIMDGERYPHFGTIKRVPSGQGGPDSFEGNYHALVSGREGGAWCCGSGEYGPFTRFDHYREKWTGPWEARVAVYLDTSWPSGAGFDYALAVSRNGGGLLRDYVFHVTKDSSSGGLLVAVDNKTSFSPREDLEEGDEFAVPSSGWHVLEHLFRPDNGRMVAVMRLLDAKGEELHSWTISHSGDFLQSFVGGNNYGWFMAGDIPGGLAVDGLSLTVDLPQLNIGDCPTGVNDITFQGNSLSSWVESCHTLSGTQVRFLGCLTRLTSQLRHQGLLTPGEQTAILGCAAKVRQE